MFICPHGYILGEQSLTNFLCYNHLTDFLRGQFLVLFLKK